MPHASSHAGARTSAARKRAAPPPSEPEELIQTSFRLPRSRWTKLHTLSIEDRLSVQAIIVSALEAEFERRGLTF